MFSLPVRFHSSLQCVDWDSHNGVNERPLFTLLYVSNGVGFFLGGGGFVEAASYCQQRCQKTLQVLKIDWIYAKFSVWNESSKPLRDHYSVLEQAEPIQMDLWAVQTRVCVQTSEQNRKREAEWSSSKHGALNLFDLGRLRENGAARGNSCSCFSPSASLQNVKFAFHLTVLMFSSVRVRTGEALERLMRISFALR